MDTFDFEAYKNKINELEYLRKTDHAQINKMLAITDNLLKRFQGVEKKSISFADLDTFELNKWYSVDKNERVKIKKIESSKKKIIFETTIKEGGEFGWHFHKDCSERCDVLEGVLHDLETDTSYYVGESVFYLPGIEHVPVALLHTKLLVTFIYVEIK